MIGHEVIGLTWPMAFALGAIVSPTDPVAATTIMRRLGAPRRIVNVVEGESLVNDATALVAYRVAVAAAVGGSFSVMDAGFEFVWSALGGIAIGLVVGYVVAEIRRRLDDTPTELTISLLTAYAAFVPADALGVSGVLAAVTTGIYMGWRAPEIASPQTRLQGFALWEMLVFLLNATLFILIGLQLPVIVDALQNRSTGEVVGYSALVCATVIGARFVWTFTAPYVVRALDRRPQQRARRVGWRDARRRGMGGHARRGVARRGARAAARDRCRERRFPDRDLVLFITFAVILVTLVGQGLTLPWLIRRLGVVEDGAEEEAEEIRARVVASRAALERIDELVVEDWVRDDTAERLRALYRFRVRRFKVRAGKMEDEDGIEDRSMSYQRLLHELYVVQRQALVELRNGGTISNEVMHRIERELDLEESRLEI